jgi:hypothetical protein
VCDVDTTGTPSIFKIICSVTTLTRIFPHLDFIWEENVGERHTVVVELKRGQFPDELNRRLKGFVIWYEYYCTVRYTIVKRSRRMYCRKVKGLVVKKTHGPVCM